MGLKCHWAVLKRQNCRSFIAAMSCHNDENSGARENQSKSGLNLTSLGSQPILCPGHTCHLKYWSSEKLP